MKSPFLRRPPAALAGAAVFLRARGEAHPHILEPLEPLVGLPSDHSGIVGLYGMFNGDFMGWLMGFNGGL